MNDFDMNEPNEALNNFLASIVPEKNIFFNESMKNHTTFRVGGNAKILVRISHEEELLKLIPYLNNIGEPYYVKGNGSNLLVGDKGYNGVILEIASQYNDISVINNTITASAGALMSNIAKASLEASLTGFEFASGIPGTIGGGVVMNAGAYDGELKDCVTSVKVMDPKGEIYTIDNQGMSFGYRTSVLKARPFTVLEVTLKLNEGKKEDIKARMDELSVLRRQKQPLEYPSAGSTFKRPEGYFAGKLIMDAGLRGYSIGGAQVSEKHCGFVINKGNATASDVYELILEIEEKVKDKFNVNLEPEIIFLGSF